MNTDQWQTSPRHERPGDLVRWHLAASLDNVGLQLGLSEEGCWVVVGPSSATELRHGSHPVFLLPLLQMGRSEALSALGAEISAHSQDPAALDRLPVEDLVIAGLESGAEHWSSMALAWAAEMEPSSRLADALASLSLSGVTQSIRHRAQRISRVANVR